MEHGFSESLIIRLTMTTPPKKGFETLDSILGISAGYFTFLLDIHKLTSVHILGSESMLDKMSSVWGQNVGHW